MNRKSQKDDAPMASEMLLSRRRLLKGAVGMAMAAAAHALMPSNVQRVLAMEPPRNSSFKDIKHVVLLMQENRSFDHYFGTMAGIRGFGDPRPTPIPSGNNSQRSIARVAATASMVAHSTCMPYGSRNRTARCERQSLLHSV